MDSIIVINNLSFKFYDKNIIDNLCLEIDRGDFISIVGPNGSGKSTLVKLLLGLYESNGIKIDGLDVNETNIYDIRKNWSTYSSNCIFTKANDKQRTI